MLNDSMNSFVITRYSMRCQLMGRIIFGLILGRVVMYRCVSHTTLVTKSCGGVWRNGVRLGRSVWENAFHRHCNLSVVIVAMYLPC